MKSGGGKKFISSLSIRCMHQLQNHNYSPKPIGLPVCEAMMQVISDAGMMPVHCFLRQPWLNCAETVQQQCQRLLASCNLLLFTWSMTKYPPNLLMPPLPSSD